MKVFKSFKDRVNEILGSQPERAHQEGVEEVVDLFADEELRERPRDSHTTNTQSTRAPVHSPSPVPQLQQERDTRRKRSAPRSEEERRFFGDTRVPKDATIIPIPGIDTPLPTMPRKPYSWSPTNTLNEPSRFSPAQAVKKTYGKSPRPSFAGRALDLESHRGENVVRSQQDYSFPDEREDRVKKRKMTHNPTERDAFELGDSAEIGQRQSQQSVSHVSQRSLQLESHMSQKSSNRGRAIVGMGSQESYAVHNLLRKDRGARSRRSHHALNGEQGQPIELSDDESPVQQSDKLSLLENSLLHTKRRISDGSAAQRKEDIGATRSRYFHDSSHASVDVDLTDEQEQAANKDKNNFQEVYATATDLASQHGDAGHIPIYDDSLNQVPNLRDKFKRDEGKSPVARAVRNSRAEGGRDCDSVDELSLTPTAAGKGYESRSQTKEGPQRHRVANNSKQDFEIPESPEPDPRSNDIQSQFRQRSPARTRKGDRKKGHAVAWTLIHYQANNAPKIVVKKGESPLVMKKGTKVTYGRAVETYVPTQDGIELPDQYYIPLSKITMAQHGPNTCPLLRLSGASYVAFDLVFSTPYECVTFLEALGHTIKKVERKEDQMKKIFGKFPTDRIRIHPPSESDGGHPPAVDQGVEDAILERKQALRYNDSRPSYRKGLTAQMQVSELRKIREQSSQIHYEQEEPNQEACDRRVAEKLARQDSEPRRSGRKKSTRAYFYKSPTPDVPPLKPKAELGTKWEHPVVYPPVGKKRTTVEFSDLERLDDGEFLNDNLIEFYLKFLVERERQGNNLKEKQVYFFSTHFYSALTATAPGNRGLNYEAIKRWTGKEDIFSHDFLVVPVNENLHWYLAIICNLPKLKREQSSAKAENEKDSVKQSIESVQEPVTIDLDALSAVDENRLSDSEIHDESPGLREPFASQMHISEPLDSNKSKVSTPKDEVELVLAGHIKIEANGTEDDVHAAAQDRTRSRQSTPARSISQIKDSQSSGVFSNAKPSSPVTTKKGKRKSAGPPLRKYNPDQPAIIILDSMGSARNKTIANLKEYLILEGLDKRDLEISKDDFQGFHARSGIPQQETFYDCGIYVCGYVDKFMKSPADFGKKLLAQEFTPDDWPEMKPQDMRDNIRSMLQDLAKEQNERRNAEKKARKEAKRKARIAAGGVPDAVSSPLAIVASSQVPTRNNSPIKATPKPSRANTPKLSTTTLANPKKTSSPFSKEESAVTPRAYRQRDSSPPPRSRSASPGKAKQYFRHTQNDGDVSDKYIMDSYSTDAIASSPRRVSEKEEEAREEDWVSQLEQFAE